MSSSQSNIPMCRYIRLTPTRYRGARFEPHHWSASALEHPTYFVEGYRDSRITKITRKVIRPTDMDIEISDVLSKGIFDSVDDNISDLSSYVKVATGGFRCDWSWDNTHPTDSNVFSARKALKESLSRQRDDVAKGLITLLKE